MFSRKRVVPPNLPVFANLPVRRVTIGPVEEQMAVHVAGRVASGRTPIICLPGYHRNMAD